MKKLILTFGVFLLAFAGVSTAKAVQSDEVIKTFDTKVVISKDNAAHISETIAYDLGSTPHHGIYRDIPIDYHDGANDYFLTVSYDKTTDENGNTVQADTEEVNGNLRIRLGDPDRTITGVHTYKISYTLKPLITKVADRPFLNLDVVGTGWEVPIEKATAQVSLENDAKLTDISCFYGPQGAKSPCVDTADAPEGIALYTVTNLSPMQGMSINAHLPEGYISNYLQANQNRPIDWLAVFKEYWFFIIFVPPAILLAIILSLQKYRAYTLRKKQIVVAQYDPPTSLTPAEIGHLEDDSSDMAEVTATIISFAVRGYLKISQEEKKGIGGIFGGNDYTLTKIKPDEGLSTSEAGLFNKLFKSGDSVKLDDLDKSAMASEITSFDAATKKSLEEKGFYAKTGGVLEKGQLTDAGAKEWALVDGFKLFLNVVEKDRLKFTDAPEKTPERFSKLLPYAIALGVEEQWAKQFEGIDISSSTNNWYHGNMATFSAMSLSNDLSSGFASAVESNSSVSSSGGSSGGGFGGGGGGSW